MVESKGRLSVSDVELSLHDALHVAVQNHRAGNAAAAQHVCRQILATDPRQADALHLLGVSLHQQGDLQAAAEHVALALAVDPGLVTAYRSLGTIYTELNRLPEATRAWQKLIALRPGDADAHSRLAAVLADQGQFDQSEAACWRAVELQPHNLQFQLELGSLHYQRGRVAQAIFVFSQIIALTPAFVPAYRARARALADHALWDEAVADYRTAVELDPRDAPSWTELGKTLGDRGETVEAEACCRHAIALDPSSALPWSGLGQVLETNGRFDAAAAAFERAAELGGHTSAGLRLAGPSRERANDEAARLRTIAQDAASSDEKVLVEFALGRHLDSSGHFDEAFGVYARANARFKKLSADRGFYFSGAALRRTVDDMVQTFSPQFFHQCRGWGDPSEVPVFIVGMPRSGTTLVEQIVSSHSEVFGAGERFDIAMIRSRLASAEHGGGPAQWSQQSVAVESRAQLQRLSRLGKNRRRVVDKMPENLLDLGLIAMLFPNARIICCRRDPRDTCLSCFFQKFARYQHLFSYDLADCAVEFNQLKRLDEHWQRALPLRTLIVEYEQLVADLQGQSRRLVEFLGLPWEPQCLAFHQTQRPILTSSAWQVRQPIYTRSVGRWRNYERVLEPLAAALA